MFEVVVHCIVDNLTQQLYEVSGCEQLGKCDLRHYAHYKCWQLNYTYNCKFRLDDASRFVKI